MKSGRSLSTAPGNRLRPGSFERAFLPAALEVVETPPHPAGHAIAFSVAALFTLALAWAIFGEIDMVSTAPGKIVPSGRIKIIQPFATGVVSAIHVEDGKAVKTGDVLIELDPTLSEADQRHMQADLLSAQLDVARLKAALSEAPDPLAEFHPPAGANPQQLAAERQLLIHQTSEQRAKLAVLDRQLAQKEAERETVLGNIAKDKATIPVLQQQVDIRKTLFEHETGAKLTYLAILQQLVTIQQDLPVQEGNLHGAEAEIAGVKETRGQTEAEYRRTLSEQLTAAELKAAETEQDFIKAQEMSKRQVLTAPVDGTVQQLSVHTVGGVVQPAQPLLVVVPSDSHFEVEAMVSNNDIGFVHPGQEAEIKISTFEFTRYGTIHGEVLSVSADAVTPSSAQSNPGGQPAPGAPAPPSAASPDPSQAQGLYYAARISLDATQMVVQHKVVDLGPGMAVSADIKIGSRPIITYFLSPLLKYKEESLHER